MVKMFVRNDQLADILGDIKNGAFLKLKGVTTVDRFDSELNIQSVVGIKKISDFTESRVDTAPEKRVELHCHTKMSDMDAVTDVTTLLKQAHEWGHPAMAITGSRCRPGVYRCGTIILSRWIRMIRLK